MKFSEFAGMAVAGGTASDVGMGDSNSAGGAASGTVPVGIDQSMLLVDSIESYLARRSAALSAANVPLSHAQTCATATDLKTARATVADACLEVLSQIIKDKSTSMLALVFGERSRKDLYLAAEKGTPLHTTAPLRMIGQVDSYMRAVAESGSLRLQREAFFRFCELLAEFAAGLWHRLQTGYHSGSRDQLKKRLRFCARIVNDIETIETHIRDECIAKHEAMLVEGDGRAAERVTEASGGRFSLLGPELAKGLSPDKEAGAAGAAVSSAPASLLCSTNSGRNVGHDLAEGDAPDRAGWRARDKERQALRTVLKQVRAVHTMALNVVHMLVSDVIVEGVGRLFQGDWFRAAAGRTVDIQEGEHLGVSGPVDANAMDAQPALHQQVCRVNDVLLILGDTFRHDGVRARAGTMALQPHSFRIVALRVMFNALLAYLSQFL